MNMALSTQLRLIVLAAGVLLLVLIYLLGRRRAGNDGSTIRRIVGDQRIPQNFEAVSSPSIDEDEYDEPSYLRRSARRDRTDTVAIHDADDDLLSLPSVHIDPVYEVPLQVTQEFVATDTLGTARVPVLSMQDPDKTMPMKVESVLPSVSDVEAVNQSITQPVTQPQSINAPMQRQLIALRLAMSEAVSGVQLLAMFHAENLLHGKFNIFHRLHQGETIFSVASMVEPGSFDLASMPSQEYRGISLFMLLPCALPSMNAFENMMSCAQRLAHLTSGVVQDENGVMLLESGIERLRDKVRDFERSLA